MPEPGPYGECWLNAYRVHRADPERYVYCEGLVVVTGRGAIKLDDGCVIWRGCHYPHAWVLDRSATAHGGAAARECTAGWDDQEVEAIGAPLPSSFVASHFGPTLGGTLPGAASLLETAHRRRPRSLSEVLAAAEGAPGM